jgi:subtilase family serine protease
MRHGIQPARLTRSRRAHLAAALLPSVVLAAGCTASSGTTARGAASPAGAVSGCQPPGSCYAPHQFRVAYGIQPLLDRGIDGRGETVTVLAPAPSLRPPAGPSPGQRPAATDIRQDLNAFDRMSGLPAARIQVVTSLAGAASPWQASGEEVQDTEIVHAVAPAAALRVVLLPSNLLKSAATATADMLAGLRLAVSGTDVASISWSLGEHYFTTAQVAQMHSILLGAAAHHVTVIASSGDHGASSDPWWGTPSKEVSLPASDPLVLAVGGTALTANPSTGAYISETAWNGENGQVQNSAGSGGGFSHRYARPAYQDGVPGISTARGVPDVASAAGLPGGGLSLVFASGGKTWIVSAGGTSASAPLWSGLIALADQYAHHDLGFVNPAIYRAARSPSYHKAFHDVTTGSNTVTIGTITVTGYQAGPGWNPVTGWGSPDAQVLIPLLARLTGHSKTRQEHTAARRVSAARPLAPGIQHPDAGQIRAKLASTSDHASRNPSAQGKRRLHSRASLPDRPHHSRRTNARPRPRTGRYGRGNPRGRHSSAPLLFGDMRAVNTVKHPEESHPG